MASSSMFQVVHGQSTQSLRRSCNAAKPPTSRQMEIQQSHSNRHPLSCRLRVRTLLPVSCCPAHLLAVSVSSVVLPLSHLHIFFITRLHTLLLSNVFFVCRSLLS